MSTTKQIHGGWFVCLVLLLGAANAVAAVLPACTAGRFPDYRDFGCRLPSPWPDLALPSPAGCPPCDPSGMPRWWVSEPFQNLWVADEPLSYPMSHGERMKFRWTHKQRYKFPGVGTFFGYGNGLTNGAGRDAGSGVPYRDMRTHGATNAAWYYSWLSDLTFWDYNWEANFPACAPLQPCNPGPLFNSTYDVFWYRADGGILQFQPTAAASDSSTRVKVEALGALGRPVVSAPTAGTDGYFWGGTQTNGLRILHPDGAVEIYGLSFFLFHSPTNTRISTAKAFLTQRVDPQGRITRIGYEKVTLGIETLYRPRYVVDPDGKTNTIRYVTNQRWQVSEIEDPHGRKTLVEYGAGYGPAKLIDAQNLTNNFAYQTGSGWLSSYATPYGTTSFEYFEELEPNFTEYFRRRAVRVSEPDGSKQLYLYHHKTDAAGTPSSISPIPSVAGWAFDNGTTGTDHPELYHRNSFHWGARQYTALSGLVSTAGTLSNLLNTITNNASVHRLAHMKHWLFGNDGISVLDLISAEREPSLDSAGNVAGAWAWYAYGNSSQPHREPAESLVGCIARLLPDGSPQFQATDSRLSTTGLPTQQRESYTTPFGTNGFRTNWFQYAANGIDLLVTSNSPGQFTKLGWTTNHLLTRATNALTEVTAITYTDVLGEQKPQLIAFPSGQTATLDYYRGYWSNSVYYWLPEARFLKSIQWAPGPTWSFGYEKALVKHATNDLGLRLTLTWDDLLRLTSVSFPDGTYTSNRYTKLDLVATRDRLGHWTHAGYDAMQRLTALTNANNAVTTLDWCGCGALNSITDALTNTTSLFYNNQGTVTNVLFADGRSVKYFHDTAGRMTNVLDGLSRSLKFAYNNQGLVTAVSNTYGPLERVLYDAVDRPLEITDADGVTVTNSYDLLNRVLKRTWLDGFSESFGWRTNGLVAHTNRNNQIKRFARDAAGRLTAVTNANLEVTRAFYNSLGQVTDLFDGLNHQTSWTYDEYGRQRSKTDASSRTTSWDYNANGWLTNRTTPQFGTTGFTYDPVGNLTSILYPQSSILYAYDALNQLTNVMDAAGTTKFTYTAAGQLASEDGPWASDTVSYGYTEGLRTALSVSGGWAQTYAYDGAWRLTNVTSSAGAFGFTYHASRLTQLVGITLPNAATITKQYDALGRLDHTALKNPWGHVLDGYAYTHDPLGLRTNVTRDFGLATTTATAGYDNVVQLTRWSAKEAGGALRMNEQRGWNYDAAGNLHFRTNAALLQTFTVDNANELTGITRNTSFTLTGNTPSPATNVTVNAATADRYGDFTFARTNLSLADGNNNFTVIAQNPYGLSVTNSWTQNLPQNITLQSDLNGNLTNDGVRAFFYDAENQLTNITVASQWKSEFVYDGFGRKRIAKDYGWQAGAWVKTNETRYVYDGLLVVQERDANNATLVTYTRGLDLSGSRAGAGGIGGLLARTDANGSAFYHADGAGNVTALMNSTGELVARYLYDPFGNLVGKWGPLADANRYRFSSKEVHPLSGLYYYGFRFYEPNLQRWLNQDPIEEEGGINLFTFVDNDPVNWFDTDGLSKRSSRRSGGNATSGPAPPTGLGGRYTRRDIQRELQRQQWLSRYERWQEEMANAARWREKLGRDIRYGETFLSDGSTRPAQPSIPCPPTQRHHSDPKFLEGNPRQPLTEMTIPRHQWLHRDLNSFLRTRTDALGNDMSPRRGNSGESIRENFTRGERLQALSDFYRNNGNYPDAARDFFNQHPGLK